MASSSSSSTYTYHVFLNFRGEDTRDSFISHLNAALCRRKIKTFIDNQLIRGDEISLSLLNAIQESKISVVVFSEGYASSKWCLEELVKILECKNKYGQIVIPVFYHVDPSVVRNQTGTFRDAFSKHEERFKDNSEKLQKWRNALTEAANLSGFDSNVIRSESQLIEKIIQDVLKRLNHMSPSDNNDLIGVKASIEKIESLLCSGSSDVFGQGIWGIGGIGKTTLAEAVFNKISSRFQDSYFAYNVREESEKDKLIRLRQELLSTILDEEYPNTRLTFTKERLQSKKVLIVFDDVTHLKQIEDLIRDYKCLCPGSRIIITTRDKRVLKNCGIDEANIFNIEELCEGDALQLFNRYAFKQNSPPKDYIEFSIRVARYCKGVPLALKLAGSFLFGRRLQDWQSALVKLERTLPKDIQNVLKVSYDGLDDQERDIFLDIACFLKGEGKNVATEFLDACGFSAEIGIDDLIDKSLISVSDDKIKMHDLLQEMGKEVVRQESIKFPGKRSRLWHHEDIIPVLTKNTGTKRIESISLDMSKLTKDIHINSCAFRKMHRLRFLKFYSSSWCLAKQVHASQYLQCSSTELRYLYWIGCPLKSLETNFHVEFLVSLVLCHNKVEHLWDGVQLKFLKYLTLSGCSRLERLPDEFGNLEALKQLQADGTAIREVPFSITCLNKLEHLCIKTQSLKGLVLPSLSGLSSLTFLNLNGCRIIKLPDSIGELYSLQRLFLGGNNFESIPANIKWLSKLSYLCLNNCGRLQSLPELPGGTKNVDAYNCVSLEKLSPLSGLFGFNLANCFKFDLNALQDSLKGHLLRAQEVKPWTAPPQEFYQSCICYTGNEIPEWFSFPVMGSSMSIEVPPYWDRKILIGLAFCAVVEFPDHMASKHLYISCCFKTRDGDQIEFRSFAWEASTTFEPLALQHDHVFISFHHVRCSASNQEPFELRDIEFEARNDEWSCKVKKCGIHLLYGHVETNTSLNSGEDEEEPEPKKMKYSEIVQMIERYGVEDQVISFEFTAENQKKNSSEDPAEDQKIKSAIPAYN
ncbi:disease resistance-like protein DSC1 [Pistacia vera]|uniref:disease resistance-like protein DSC1 n=1 Tax=Pistacia vera TaxID=55513 RepID=UPI0012638786|nr:disease resistance-like protein DSC1 [Pistacia vera]